MSDTPPTVWVPPATVPLPPDPTAVVTSQPPYGDAYRALSAEISDAYHEGFGAGIASVQDEIAEQVAAAEARGYDKAIANLRDDNRFLDWHLKHPGTYVTRAAMENAVRYLNDVKETPNA